MNHPLIEELAKVNIRSHYVESDDLLVEYDSIAIDEKSETGHEVAIQIIDKNNFCVTQWDPKQTSLTFYDIDSDMRVIVQKVKELLDA